MTTAAHFFALTKPRILPLVLFTGLAALAVSSQSAVSLTIMIGVLLGTRKHLPRERAATRCILHFQGRETHATRRDRIGAAPIYRFAGLPGWDLHGDARRQRLELGQAPS